MSAFLVRGYRRGAISELGGLVAWIVGLAAGVLYAPTAAVYFAKALPVLTERLTAWLTTTAAASRAEANPLITSPLGEILDLGLPVGPFLGEWLGRGFLTVIFFILIFLVVGGVVRLLASLISSAVNRSVLGGLNRLLGLVAGGLVGGLVLGLALSIAGFIAKLGPGGSPLGAAINRSVLTPHLVAWFVWVATQVKLWVARF
jgi:uncharacterized membrane protein required for colicin V production